MTEDEHDEQRRPQVAQPRCYNGDTGVPTSALQRVPRHPALYRLHRCSPTQTPTKKDLIQIASTFSRFNGSSRKHVEPGRSIRAGTHRRLFAVYAMVKLFL